MNLDPVRFRFFGKGHDQPITGHLYLRWADGTWRLSNWRKADSSFKDRLQSSGEDYQQGAKQFLDMLTGFFAEWGVAQQKAINDTRYILGRQRPKDMIGSRGFRPVVASTHWIKFRHAVQNENRMIQSDVDAVLGKLKTGGWLLDPQLVLPVMDWREPWA